MTPETETLLKKVQTVTNTFNSEGELVTPATRYLTYQEREDRKTELDEIERFLNQPPEVMRTIDVTPQRMRQLRERRKKIRTDLDQNSPPENLTGEQKDKLWELERDLSEKIASHGMLSEEEMTRNPVGAVGRNVRWLNATKIWQLVYKNVRRALDPKSQDKDLANIEMLRPSKFRQGGPSVYLGDTQMKEQMSYSHISDEKWEGAGLPLMNPNSPMARKSAEELEQEIATLKAQLAEKDTPKPKVEAKAASKTKGMSEEAKQKMRDMMNKRWAEKRSKQVESAT